MRWLLFLSKLALLCNLAFLVSFVFRFTSWLDYQDIKAYIIIIGWVLGIIFNPLVVVCYLLFFLLKRQKLAPIPAWLMVTNVFFLFLQLIYLLFLNVE